MGREQLILILLIGLISFINWIIQKSAELREKRKLERRIDQVDTRVEAEPPPLRQPAQAEENPDAAMRRFMEALGLPAEAEPPPPPQRHSPPPQMPEPEPVLAATETFPEPTRAPARLPRLAIERRQTPSPFETAIAPTTAKSIKPPHTAAHPSRFRQLLASPEGLRDGIILSEILSPPRALRS